MSEVSPTPLAERMRPTSLLEFVGQEHLLGVGRPLRHLVDSRSIHSMILWGPPGTGKTTLAKLLAEEAHAEWISMSAVLAGVKEVRAAIAAAESQLTTQTVLFIDEIHRFNKAQQDAFLPHVESGTITLVGATTENPAFELNSALLSRTRVFVLKSLTEEDICSVIGAACNNDLIDATLTDEAIKQLVLHADGDARRALNALEIAAQLATDRIELVHVVNACGQTQRRFDKHGDQFYDQISALHKAVRGSSPDAALYWFLRMLDGGCDPLYIARRLVRIATEDVGTADPRALGLALNCWDAYQRLGSPEGELAIAQTVLYLATVPKSNAVYSAYKDMKEYVSTHPAWDVPSRFRNAPTQLARSLGHGEGYRYAHAEEGAFAVGERYFPDEMPDEVFYTPTDNGVEARIRERLAKLAQLNRDANSSKK